ncbi:MAG TPA: hypothetical protein VL463_00415 [Kofleriaceae bacterium]|nr:hypothetical protein [Kofleriaceae bacterium]
MRATVERIERAWAAAGLKQGPLPDLADPIALAATTAIASRFLAVGTPRTIGLVGPSELAELCLDAHRVYFSPTEVRRDDLRATCAADIVCIVGDVTIEASWLRAGTHVNLMRGRLDGAPRAIFVGNDDLAAIVCGLRDGRQLDELTIYRYA